jgi:hypothetical protein
MSGRSLVNIAQRVDIVRARRNFRDVCRFEQNANRARCMINTARRNDVLWTLCVILLVLWALGMVTAYTAGGLIHLLLVIALVVVVINLISGRRVV